MIFTPTTFQQGSNPTEAVVRLGNRTYHLDLTVEIESLLADTARKYDVLTGKIADYAERMAEESAEYVRRASAGDRIHYSSTTTTERLQQYIAQRDVAAETLTALELVVATRLAESK